MESRFGVELSRPRNNIFRFRGLNGQILSRIVRNKNAAQRELNSVSDAKKELDLQEANDLFFKAPSKSSQKESHFLLRENFINVFYPLLEELKFSSEKEIQAILENFAYRKYAIRTRNFEAQRTLSTQEKEYIQSVERLSSFNPLLVAMAVTNPTVLNQYLSSHFENLSTQTLLNLKNGDYVPAIQVGTGPNGMASIGEILRQRPDLMKSMLVVDEGKDPGGPFAVPQGPAWRLNSKNINSADGRAMPDPIEVLAGRTIRAYSSPIRWYPGERSKKEVARSGSINTPVEYLPSPDDISTDLYANNADLQQIIAIETALLVNNLALKTKIIKIEPNLSGSKGNKTVTLEFTQKGKTKTLKINTDALILASGIGEPYYGFPLETSRAKTVIEASKNLRLPKLTNTLEAFSCLNSLVGSKDQVGETLVIYGGRDSLKTLLEYIGRIYDVKNPNLKGVKQIIIVTNEKDLEGRCRYEAIKDLFKSGFVKIIKDRVSDVDFESIDEPVEKRKLVFYDSEGKPIKTESDEVLKADRCIAATGFKSQISDLLLDYQKQMKSRATKVEYKKIRLPTNQFVPVGRSLKVDPSVLMIGTAYPSLPDSYFLDQLPRSSQNALRSISENLVAIGFKTAEAQAAINIALNNGILGSLDTSKTPLKTRANRKKLVLKLTKDDPIIQKSISFSAKELVASRKLKTDDANKLLRPVFLYDLGNQICVDPTIPKALQEIFKSGITLKYNRDKKEFILNYQTNRSSKKIFDLILEICNKEAFQSVLQKFFDSKISSTPSLTISISFDGKGYIDPRLSYLE